MDLHTTSDSLKRRTTQSVHSPLLVALMFWMGGYVLAQHAVLATPLWILITCTTGSLYWLSRFAKNHWFLWVAIIPAGACWYSVYQKQLPAEFSDAPPREAVLTLRSIHRFHSSKPDSQLGIANIIKASHHLKFLEGEKCNYAVTTNSPIHKGDYFEIKGILKPRSLHSEELKEFDHFLLKKQIHWSVFRSKLLNHQSANSPISRLQSNLLKQFENSLSRGHKNIDGPHQVTTSMILGQRWRLSDAQETYFQYSGTLHFFAISGLHVGILALFLNLIFGLLRLPSHFSTIPLSLCLLIYVWVTGMSPSAIRAAVMVILFHLIYHGKRQPSATASLTLSAWIYLMLFPLEIWHLGFQLSYAVVMGILFIGIPLSQLMIEFTKNQLPRPYPRPQWDRWLDSARIYLLSSIGISLSATIASAPLIIGQFEIWTPYGIFLNLILSPFILLIVFAGFTQIFFDLILPFDPLPIWNFAGWLLVEAVNEAIRFWVNLLNIDPQRIWFSHSDTWICLTLTLGLAWLIRWIQQCAGKPSNAWNLLPCLVSIAYILFRSGYS